MYRHRQSSAGVGPAPHPAKGRALRRTSAAVQTLPSIVRLFGSTPRARSLSMRASVSGAARQGLDFECCRRRPRREYSRRPGFLDLGEVKPQVDAALGVDLGRGGSQERCRQNGRQVLPARTRSFLSCSGGSFATSSSIAHHTVRYQIPIVCLPRCILGRHVPSVHKVGVLARTGTRVGLTSIQVRRQGRYPCASTCRN